jgi:hypothetical protein
LNQENKLHQKKDILLNEQIESVLASQPSYGYRKIAIELNISKKRVRRCMKEYGIKPYKRKARWRKRRDEQRKPAAFSKMRLKTSVH